MRSFVTVLVVALWVGCGPSNRTGDDSTGDDDAKPPPDACSGLGCAIVDCAKTGRPSTTVTGKVFAPNGTLALFGVSVYVPASPPNAFPEGASCTRCEELSGGVVVKTVSDEAGQFVLTDVPVGKNIPLVITIGKWRRMINIPTVSECIDNPLPATAAVLPRNRSEGELPRIAVATGGCDALECLIRKIGISDQEFTASTGNGRIHLFASNGATRMADNTPFNLASSLWSNVDKLKLYDLVLNSCECSPLANEKTQAMMDTMKQYADAGGRLFLSHYHNIWIAGERGNPTHGVPAWTPIASCPSDSLAGSSDTIDQVNNPKGPAFARWMLNVGGSSALGTIPITESKQTCTSVDNTKAERWVYWQNGTSESPQNFQFTTPNEIDKDQRCGKVVFSDMHVASGSFSSSSTGFPGGCAATPMTAQEKALAFMFFDIASCVGPIF